MNMLSAANLGLVTLGPAPTPADPTRRPAAELKALAEQAARELEGAPADEIARWAVDTFGDRFCVTSSMADAVLAHLVSRVAPGVDVVFLDTGLHFPETLKVRDTVARTLPVTVRSIRPRLTVGQQDGEYGPRLFAKAPDECCALRKVEPLERALGDYDAWAAGLRRDESPTRANTPVVTFDARRGKVKVNPIAAWTPGRRGRLHLPVERAGQRAVPVGLHLGRLLAVHPADQGRRGPAGRPLGDVREDRVRPARMTSGPGPVVLVAHGSRDPRAAVATRALVRAVEAARPGLLVRASYLDHTRPESGGGAARAGVGRSPAGDRGAAAAHRRVPRSGRHSRGDRRRARPGPADAGTRDRRTRPVRRPGSVAMVDGLLLAGLRRRLTEAGPGRELVDGVVLAAAGTRDADARRTVDVVAGALGAALGVPCLAAYASAAPPTAGVAVRRLRAGGARRVAVAAYFLAPGRLYESAVASARDAGAVAVAAPLADAPELAQLVLDRVDAAADLSLSRL